MNVLSLFDGMACGMLAFNKLDIPVENYYAYEIDKYAIQTALHNFPQIKECGDVFEADFTQYEGIDYLIGGSPCTYWSIAQSPDKRETTASGIGWELFSQYVRALKEAKPKYFVYENNKSMAKAIYQSISETFGFEPIMINSALVSAQNRQRYYWVGKRNDDGTYSKIDVEQPEDRGILLRDILDGMTDREKGRAVIGSAGGSMTFESVRIPEYGNFDKARPIGAKYPNNCGGFEHRMFSSNPNKQQVDMVAEPVCVASRGRYKNDEMETEQHLEVRGNKTNALTTVQKDNMVAEPVNTTVDGKAFCCTAHYYKGFGNNPGLPLEKHRDSMVAEPICVASSGGAGGKTGLYAVPIEFDGDIPTKAISYADGKTYTVYKVSEGKITIKGKTYPIKLSDGYYIIRKLTVSECKRLQTVPEWYEFPVSDTQAYKMIGNGWTIDVIAHILSYTQNGGAK